MSQVISQDSPLQNCTNTLNMSPVSSKDAFINLITPTKMKIQSSLDDFIDLTTPKLIQKSPKSMLRNSEYCIDEIVISDSDDESPPKRMKDCEFSTPTRVNSVPTLFEKYNSPLPVSLDLTLGLHTKFYSSLKDSNIASISPNECHTIQNSVNHSTPVSEMIMPTTLLFHESSDAHYKLMGSGPHLTPIKTAVDSCDYSGKFYTEEQLLPTDVTTVELFASSSKTPSETSRNVTHTNTTSKCIINDSSYTSPPEMNCVQSKTAMPTANSQLAEQFNIVGFEDKPIQYFLPSESNNSEFYTPKGKVVSEEFFTPITAIPFPTTAVKLTLQRLESNQSVYNKPGSSDKFLGDISVEGKEIPNEWIDDSINLPLEGQTSFVKINSLQFVRSCITTPRVKITKFLLAPLITYLTTSQDVKTTVQTANLLCDVIKTHPATAVDNIACYRDVFTWDLLSSSLETLSNELNVRVELDIILKLYCDVIESELMHSQFATTSYTRSLFWPKSSCASLSDILKDLIASMFRLFYKHSPIIYTLFRLFELVLDWSIKSDEIIWHEPAAYEFHSHFSNLKTEDYSQFIGCIGPPWFAGYIAQIRLREIGVPTLQEIPFSTNLKEFFTTHTNFLPTHPQEKLHKPAINTALRDRLIKASQLGECHSIKQLIRAGCDPNICDEKSWNSLLRACWYGIVCSVEAIVESSLESNTRVNIVQINAGATPLHLAAKCGNIDVCVCLLKMGGPSLLLHRDKDGYFPYQMATNSKLVKLLKIDYCEDKFDRIAASLEFNTELRVPIELSVILEFEFMLCTALKGIFIKGGFDEDDVTACQQAHLFVQKLTSQINKSQLYPVELTRLAALINSYFF